MSGAGSARRVRVPNTSDHQLPAPDKSIHDAPGFYGKYAEQGGSRNVRLSDFALRSDVRERIDTDQVNGIGGAMGGGSVIERLYIQHTKVGLWFDGPMDGLTVRDNIVVDQIADGINLRRGVSNARVTNNFFRNTGDDAMAMWSEFVTKGDPTPDELGDSNRNNRYDHNTVQTPVLANGIAIYGGQDIVVADNLVADPVREGSALHLGARFNATRFAGTITLARNTTVRGGGRDLNWNLGLGSIWFFVLDNSMTARVRVLDSDFLDSTYNAIMLVADWPVKDLYEIRDVEFRDIRVDGTGTSVLSARAAGSATFENVDARNVGAPFVNNCGTFQFDGTPEFDVQLLGTSNDGGWHETTTCEDRPPVVSPPPPSRWR